MEPADFKRWRKGLGLSQKDAAHALGLKRRVIQYYEKGKRDGKDVEIPLSVRLACWALGQGVADYHGPAKKKEEDRPADRVIVRGDSNPEIAPPVDAAGDGAAV